MLQVATMFTLYCPLELQAMEKARSRLALTPESLEELERRKQATLDATRARLPSHIYEELQRLILQAKSTEEFVLVLDTFKNGKLERRRR